MKKRSVIRAAHVDFDEITKPPEIEGDSDDFEYATLDFSRINEGDEATSAAEVITFDEVGELEESVGDDNDVNVDLDESDEESVALESHDSLAENFENLRINQQSEQATPSPPPQLTPASS